MIKLFKIYKGFLLGSILLPVGLGIMFGTIIQYMPMHSRNKVVPPTWFESVSTASEVALIIWLGVVIFFLGFGYVIGSQESKDLTKNLKNVFKK